MAVELAAGYVSLVPSLKGGEKAIVDGLGTAGKAGASNFASKFGASIGGAVGEKVGKQVAEQFAGRFGGAIGGAVGDKAGSLFVEKFGSVGLKAIGGAAVGIGLGAVGGIGVAFAGKQLFDVGVAGAKMLSDGFFEVLDRNRDADRLGAQLGFSPDKASRLGKIAGELFASNFGDSIGDVNKALKGVAVNKLLLGWASNADIEGFTGRLLNITSLFEQDVGSTTRTIATLMRTGLAKTADEALDIITRGFQTGGDTAGDLLDTLTEYPTQFRKLGLTGEVATGLISQGLQAGARDSDIVADAFKEFSIRAVDGSVLTSASFKRLGIDASKMSKTIAKGGPEAAKGLDVVLDKLRAVKDPVERAQIAVGLFGTQAEDLGDALFALDPSSAVATLGEVGGAATRAGDQMNDNLATRIDEIKRSLDPSNLLAAFQTGGFEGLKTQVGIGVDGIAAIWHQYGPEVTKALDEGKLKASAWWDEHGPEITQKVKDWWRDTGKPVVAEAFSSGAEAGLKAFKDKLLDPKFWADLPNILGPVIGGSVVAMFAQADQMIRGDGGHIWDSILDGFKLMVNGIIQVWNNLSFSIPEVEVFGKKIGGGTIDFPKIDLLATGTGIQQQGIGTGKVHAFHSGGIVPGRSGSEMLALLQAGETVLPTQRRRLVSAAAMPGGAGGFSIRDINVTGQADPHRTAQEILLGQRRAAVLSR